MSSLVKGTGRSHCGALVGREVRVGNARVAIGLSAGQDPGLARVLLGSVLLDQRGRNLVLGETVNVVENSVTFPHSSVAS